MQHRAATTRAALMAAAAELIDETGVAATGLDKIVARARVSRGALYFHFASKAELTGAIEDHARGVMAELLRRLTGQRGPVLLDAADFAVALLRRHDRDLLFRAGLRIERERARPADANALREVAAALRDRVRDGSAEFRAGTDLQATGDLLAVLVAGLNSLADEDPQWRSAETLDRLWRLVATLLMPGDLRDRVLAELPGRLAGTTAPGAQDARLDAERPGTRHPATDA